MRRVAKIKTVANRIPLRKSALTASAASRRPFPAWIAADDSGVAFPARMVTARVRDGLVLRAVTKTKVSGVKNAGAKGTSDGNSAR